VHLGVLALQGDFREHLQALVEVGAAGRPVRSPSDLDGLGGLVIPGGESTTLGMLLDSSGLRPGVAALIGSGVPVLGTCAGMILLAKHVTDGRSDQSSFGAIDIDVRRNGYGRQLSSFECELEVGGFDKPLPAVFIRAPLVVRSGPGVEVLASAEGPGASNGSLRTAPTPVLVRQGAVLAAAFHPELTADRRLHQMFVEMVEETVATEMVDKEGR
jgi:pyridoxal 5'-phosphate synthase pdxT subunit